MIKPFEKLNQFSEKVKTFEFAVLMLRKYMGYVRKTYDDQTIYNELRYKNLATLYMSDPNFD